jgi:hypothetical protein
MHRLIATIMFTDGRDGDDDGGSDRGAGGGEAEDANRAGGGSQIATACMHGTTSGPSPAVARLVAKVGGLCGNCSGSTVTWEGSEPPPPNQPASSDSIVAVGDT